MDNSDIPETAQAAANALGHPPKQSSSLARAEGDEQQAADAALDHPREHAISHDDSISQSPPATALSATESATGDKRK
jgi:hypothetical protein